MYPLVTAHAAGLVMAQRTRIPVNLATVWAGSESGDNNNPYGLTDAAGHLYTFSSIGVGAAAAASWLLDPDSPYAGVRAAIAAGDPAAIMAAIMASPWGPPGYYARDWPNVAATYRIPLPSPAGGTVPVIDPTAQPAAPSATVTPLPDGTLGTVSAGARRFAATAPYAEVASETADSVQAFDAELAIADDNGTHGTFWRTSGTPPVLFIKAAIVPGEIAPAIPTPAPVESYTGADLPASLLSVVDLQYHQVDKIATPRVAVVPPGVTFIAAAVAFAAQGYQCMAFGLPGKWELWDLGPASLATYAHNDSQLSSVLPTVAAAPAA